MSEDEPRIGMPHEVQAYRVIKHLREIFPRLHQSDQEVLARLCRQAPDLICFCGCHISETDLSMDRFKDPDSWGKVNAKSAIAEIVNQTVSVDGDLPPRRCERCNDLPLCYYDETSNGWDCVHVCGDRFFGAVNQPSRNVAIAEWNSL